MRVFLLLVISVVTFSCKSTKDKVDNIDITTVVVSDEDQVFLLKKSACYGTCPHYAFMIYKNRYCKFIGKQHTSKIGTYAKFISQDQYDKLETAFDEANFFDHSDHYESQIADLPGITLGYTKKDMSKTILGKRERPEALHKLQFLLESIAEVDKGWTQIASAEETLKEKTRIDETKIIIDFAYPNKMARWFSDMKQQFGVQTIMKLDNNFNSWLISYDTHKFTPKEMMDFLDADSTIKSAEFQKVRAN